MSDVAAPPARPRSAAAEVLSALWARPRVRACIVAVALYLLVAIAGYAHLLPDAEAAVGDAQQPPGWPLATLLGTDILGRSVLWRVLAGVQTAVTVGLATTALAVPLGTALGLAAGYFGGWADAAINWIYSVVVSVPDILLITAISYAMGKGLAAMCVAVVTATLVLVQAVKAEVVLTYLGMGVQDGASWGLLIAGATQDLVNGIWAPLAGTVAAMFLFIYALSALGDALRDALDPRVV